jgi:cell division protein FtsW (lipid II flippase)
LNLSQSLWAMASGGIWGSGLGFGTPEKIPNVYADFNFAAIIAELGLAGGALVIGLYFSLVTQAFSIAKNTARRFDRYLALGIGLCFGLQAIIVIGGNLCAIPLTGLTLPFISSGGTSFLVSIFMIAILMIVSNERQVPVNPQMEPKDNQKTID